MATTSLPSGTEAFIVQPEGDHADRLGVVIIPDIFGLRPLFEDMATRLSIEHGWHVAVIDPFAGRRLGPDVDERFDAMASVSDSRLLGDVGAAAAALAARRVGCIGFCMGGMYALKVASTGTIDRAVAFYGMIRVPLIWRGPDQGEPLELLDRASPRTKVLAIIGRKDPYTPPDDVELLRAVPAVSVVEYPDAEHGFVHDPTRPSHRPDDAADAWTQATSFLCG